MFYFPAIRGGDDGYYTRARFPIAKPSVTPEQLAGVELQIAAVLAAERRDGERSGRQFRAA